MTQLELSNWYLRQMQLSRLTGEQFFWDNYTLVEEMLIVEGVPL